MMNRIVIVGRLTKDPELRYTPNGIPVATFTLAVNRNFTNSQGEREADFIQCVIWRKPAENVANFLKKGSLAGVDGRLQTRNYEGNDGKRVYITEVLAESVQFLEPRNSSRNNNDYSSNTSYNNNSNPNPNPNTNTNTSRNTNMNNQTRIDSDPFSDNDPFSSKNTIDISDDDLPF